MTVKLGKKIKLARKMQRITQDELAQAIGVSDKSISAYESERISPPIKVLEKIATTTKRPLRYFLEESTESSIFAKLKDVENQLKEIKRLLEEHRETLKNRPGREKSS